MILQMTPDQIKQTDDFADYPGSCGACRDTVGPDVMLFVQPKSKKSRTTPGKIEVRALCDNCAGTMIAIFGTLKRIGEARRGTA